MKKQARNEPCSCGSGKKYKHCHGGANANEMSSPSKLLGTLIAAAIAGLLVWSALTLFIKVGKGEIGGPPVEGAVWSAEHGHWHGPDGQEIPVGVPAMAGPVGAPPVEGAVWSAEHGHWHGPDGQEIRRGLDPSPNDPAPPGKVWSPEHGHWH